MVQRISCFAKACLLTCAFLLFIEVFPVRGGEYYYIYSCRLGCKNRRKRDTVVVIPPYWPYGWVHTYVKIWNPRRGTYRCYNYNKGGPNTGDCSEILSCCDRYSNRRLRKRGYTSCPEKAESFDSYWSGFRNPGFWGGRKRRYNANLWNCQVYVNVLRRYLNSCDWLGDYGYMYLDGWGEDK